MESAINLLKKVSGKDSGQNIDTKTNSLIEAHRVNSPFVIFNEWFRKLNALEIQLESRARDPASQPSRSPPAVCILVQKLASLGVQRSCPRRSRRYSPDKNRLVRTRLAERWPGRRCTN